MLRLYEHPLSPYAQKCKIALREKDIEFEVVTPDAIGSGGAAGDFIAANPRAEVPALIDGDTSVFDSTIILEYLEDKWPAPPLLPVSPAERARVRMIEDVMDTQFEAINWGLSEIRYFRRATGALEAELLDRAAEQTEGFFVWLERELGARDWFNGDAFGWGDIAVVPYVNGAAGHGNPPSEGSNLAEWLARANARASVAETVREAAAVAGAMEMVADVLEQGLFKREYRDHRLEWMIKSGGLSVVQTGLEKSNIRFSIDWR